MPRQKPPSPQRGGRGFDEECEELSFARVWPTARRSRTGGGQQFTSERGMVMASWKDLLASATTERTLQRAHSALGRGTVYKLGAGDHDPCAPLESRSDCSGFVCWTLGLPRELPPRSGHWLQTDTFWAGGPPVGAGLFHDVGAGPARPGDLYVYPDAGGHQGHIGIVSQVSAGKPSAVIHCAGSNKPDAIQETGPGVFVKHSAARVMRVDYDALRSLFGVSAETPATETLRHPLLRADGALQRLVTEHRVLQPEGQWVEGCSAVQDGLNHLARRHPTYHVDLGPGSQLRGHFGPRTSAAIKAFQNDHAIQVNGLIGHDTVLALDEALLAADAAGDEAAAPLPTTTDASLYVRCLTLTAQFETSTAPPECYAGVTGNFDGQGLSFGVMQWNIGQGSLQPLLRDMNAEHPQLLEQIFGDNCASLRAMLDRPRDQQLAWAVSINDQHQQIKEPWRSQFRTLGRRPEFQDIEQRYAQPKFRQALKLCGEYGVWSERAAALMFDIVTQNGSIKPATRHLILQDFAALPAESPEEQRELQRLRIIARRRAEAANPKWVQDVLSRKLTIADGEGVVHGAHINLEQQYGLRLQKMA